MIHKFTLFDTNIVVDVNSGAVHVFDDAAFKVLDLYRSENIEEIMDKLSPLYGEAAVKEAIDEIKNLEENGLLFSEDVYQSYLPVWEEKSQYKSLCLHIAHDCNLRCEYCFASTGDFGTGRRLMSAETGKKAIDFIIKESGKRKNIEVDFFGGEPLLNFDAVKEIVLYAREREKACNKNFRFTLTTNAVLLDEEKLDFINKNMGNLVLSIDGREETNDRMRKRLDGSGTYKHILPRIKHAAESRNQQNYYVRGTYTGENLDFSEDVLHLADMGFKQISVEPVVAANGTDYEIHGQDLDRLSMEYELLAKEYVKRNKEGKGFNFFHFMIDLDQGPCVARRLTGCGAGHEYLAVTPEGDLYPCHQFVGIDRFKMGNVMDGVTSEDIRAYFRSSNIYTKEACAACWAKFYCSGGCAANAFQFNGGIDKPYKLACELEKKRLECALWIKTQL